MSSSDSTCENENGDNVYAELLKITFYVYMFDTILMLIILGLVLKKRGNWIAIVFTVT